jgi:hypothetical protein
MGQRCAASAEGIYSSFTVARQIACPQSQVAGSQAPLALATTELAGGAASEKDSHTSLGEPSGEMPILSLRGIAPRGFLTQTFATS